MKATVTIVMTTRKGTPGHGVAFTVGSKLDLDAARKAVRAALTGTPGVTTAKPKLTPERRARKAERERLGAEKATRAAARAAARAERAREKDRAKTAREAARKARQEKKDAAAARKAARTWVKGMPLVGDAVEYQEKPHGHWHVGRVVGLSNPGHYKILGDRGTRFYPDAQVKRTLKPVR